jgi:hypothetical protein
MKVLSNKNLLIGLLVVCLILLVCGYANTKADLLTFKNQIGKLEFKEQKYLETITEDGRRIVEQEQIILTQVQAMDNNLLEIERLHKLIVCLCLFIQILV